MSFKKILSSKSDEWGTPKDFFDKLDREFRFTLDPCASRRNAKCNRFFTRKDDGLAQSWGGARVFCNPPYSKVKDWIKKAWEETRKDCPLAVMLVYSRTDTAWWHDYATKGEIRFIRGRLRFEGGKYSAPCGSAVVIFRKSTEDRPRLGDNIVLNEGVLGKQKI